MLATMPPVKVLLADRGYDVDWHRISTRYDKTAKSFLGFIDITSIRLWLRHFST